MDDPTPNSSSQSVDNHTNPPERDYPSVHRTEVEVQNAALKKRIEALEREREQTLLAENENLQERLRVLESQRPTAPRLSVDGHEPAAGGHVLPPREQPLPPPISPISGHSGPAPSPFDNYDLPPIKTYDTRDAALADVNKWALKRGYAFTNAPNKDKKSGRKKAIFGCDRKSLKAKEKPRKEKGEGHNKGSKGTGCKFSIICIETLYRTGWELRYREDWKDPQTGVTTNYCEHNHPPSSGTGTEHPVHRRLKRDELSGLSLLMAKHDSGSKPRTILSELDKNGDDLTTAQDIWNALRKVRVERKQGKNCTQALVDELEAKDWISRPLYSIDEPDRLLSMFFAFPGSIEYLRLYCKVLIIDCTYNTNSSEMPLFEVIGIDATGKSFCVCFEFLPGESEEDLVQALMHLKEMLGDNAPSGVILSDKAEAQRNAIKTVFPGWTNLLCIWHANRSVNEKCKSHFLAEEFEEFMAGWINIVYSSDEGEFNKRVQKFKDRWLASHLDDVQYIEQNWLIPKNRNAIVAAWTDQHLHLGNTATSRAEGIHAVIKADIESKNIDLVYAWDIINRVVRRQLQAIDHEQKRQRINTKGHYQGRIFDQVRNFISFKALEHAYNQLVLARKIDPTKIKDVTCSRTFTKSMGIPCKHIIRQRLDTEEVLRLLDFDTSWHLRSFGVEYRRPILPPIKASGPSTRRFVRTNGSRSSTKRLESGFERAARETAQRIAYKANKKCYRCKACGPETRWGHKRNQPICPKHPKHAEYLRQQAATVASQAEDAAPEDSQHPRNARRTRQESDVTLDVIEVDVSTRSSSLEHSNTSNSLANSMPEAGPSVSANTIDITDSTDDEEVASTEHQDPAESALGPILGTAAGVTYDIDDPDYELSQYDGGSEELPGGYIVYHIGRDFNELSAEKQYIVRALMRRADGQDEYGNDDEEESGPIAERTSYQEREPTAFDICGARKQQAERDSKTMEGVYFLYKFKRNQWRKEVLRKQAKGKGKGKQKEADLFDEAYRKANKLPKYKAKELREWARMLALLRKGMPRFCESRQEPDIIWTMEEKLAWMDQDRRQEVFIEQEEERLHKVWHGKVPGHLDHERALQARNNGLVLTERQEKILEHSIWTALTGFDLEIKTELSEAHDMVRKEGTDDPLELDWSAEERLRYQAVKDTEAAYKAYQKRTKSAGKGGEIDLEAARSVLGKRKQPGV